MKHASMGAVAAEAKVATSTVSRYLAGDLKVAAETEERIRLAIDRLGFDTEAAAKRHPADRRPRLVAIVVSDLGNDYYAGFAEHTARSIEAAGYAPVTLSVSESAVEPLAGIDALISAGLAGVISIAGTRTRGLRSLLATSRVPLITVEEPHDGGKASALDIDLDNYSGARQAITYLTRLGHRNIAFISGPRDLAPVSERRRGYEDGLRGEGISPEAQFDLAGECSEEFGFAALTELLSFDGERPTAAFVAADEIAVGVLNAASQLQLAVPAELSIVGFDDIPAASHVTPRLTTIHTPLVKLADVAATALLRVLAGDDTDAGSSVVVPVSLVVRESTAAARNTAAFSS
jgi:LacI family transcriptional regulator